MKKRPKKKPAKKAAGKPSGGSPAGPLTRTAVQCCGSCRHVVYAGGEKIPVTARCAVDSKGRSQRAKYENAEPTHVCAICDRYQTPKTGDAAEALLCGGSLGFGWALSGGRLVYTKKRAVKK